MGYCPSCKHEYKPGAVLCDNCGELLPENPEPLQDSGNADTIDYDLDGASLTGEKGLADTLDFDVNVGESEEDIEATIDQDVTPAGSAGVDDTIDYNPDNPLLAKEDVGSDGEQTVEFGVDIEDESEGDAETGTVDFYPTIQNDGSISEESVDADGESTINVDAMPGSETQDFGTLDLEDPKEVKSKSPAKGAANGDDQQTYVAPSEGTPSDQSQTLDVPGGADLARPIGDNQDTLELPAESEQANPDNEATLQGAADGGIELDLDEEDLQLAEDGVDTAELAQNSADDGSATLDLPHDNTTAFGGATMEMDSFDTDHGSEADRPSGSAGKLQRMWEGVAGSNASPMASLQGLGQQASDTIFERVATRRVADAGLEMKSMADYQIVDKLGEGAMGVVFSARQAGVERVVALKTAKPNYQKSDETRRRFLYEAQITADLGHSNIVPIYELGSSEEGMLFYSMKLVDGTPWNKAVQQKSREENIEIFMKVCDAMAFAHSKGVIHRDLKPENTMLGTFGEVFVTDWGTAINLEKDSANITRAVVKGSKHLDVDDSSGLRPGDAIFFTNGKELFDRQVIDHFDSQNTNRLYFKKRLSREYEPGNGMRITKLMTMA
ncbi:MAG: protein kinase [Planctomycetota bacterium]